MKKTSVVWSCSPRIWLCFSQACDGRTGWQRCNSSAGCSSSNREITRSWEAWPGLAVKRCSEGDDGTAKHGASYLAAQPEFLGHQPESRRLPAAAPGQPRAVPPRNVCAIRGSWGIMWSCALKTLRACASSSPSVGWSIGSTPTSFCLSSPAWPSRYFLQVLPWSRPGRRSARHRRPSRAARMASK